MRHIKTLKSTFHTIEIQVTLVVLDSVTWQVDIFLIAQGRARKRVNTSQIQVVTESEIHEAKFELWEIIKPKYNDK